jgi:hypothetical protein
MCWWGKWYPIWFRCYLWATGFWCFPFFLRQAYIILHMKWHPCDCFASRSPRITCVWKMSRGRWTSWWWTRTGSRLERIQDGRWFMPLQIGFSSFIWIDLTVWTCANKI